MSRPKDMRISSDARLFDMHHGACLYLVTKCPNAKFRFETSGKYHKSVKAIGKKLDALKITYDAGDDLDAFYEGLEECSCLSAFIIGSLKRSRPKLRRNNIFGCWLKRLLR